MFWIDYLLGRYRWYRRRRGGRWERWHLDYPNGNSLWFRNPQWWSGDHQTFDSVTPVEEW